MIETVCLILGSILWVSVIVVKVFVKQTNMFYLLAIKALDIIKKLRNLRNSKFIKKTS